jgi:uncharacterized protein (TIGR01777 family)
MDSKKVIVSGGSGLIGTELQKSLRKQGIEVLSLVRCPPRKQGDVQWNPYMEQAGFGSAGAEQLERLENAHAWVHLSGANVAAGRWTSKRREELYKSRVESTEKVAEVIQSLKKPPTTLVVASAVGVYGNGGDTWMDESAEAGKGFLASLVQDWEQAARSHRCEHVRTVLLRLGVVVDKQGGALAKMLLPFKLGLGGVLGSGKQYMSWVSLRDVIKGIEFIMNPSNKAITGPINMVAPTPVTNREWTKTLGKVLSRPTPFPVPGGILKLALGYMAEEVLLSGVRVQPKNLLDNGFVFQDSDLEGCLKNVLS